MNKKITKKTGVILIGLSACIMIVALIGIVFAFGDGATNRNESIVELPISSENATVDSEAISPELTTSEIVSPEEDFSVETTSSTATDSESNNAITSNPSENSSSSNKDSSEGSKQTSSSQTSSKKPNNTSSTTSLDTSPSDAALEYSGMTASEFQEKLEALKTCRHCGHAKDGSHHRFIEDMNCPDCDEWVEGYTCHICKD